MYFVLFRLFNHIKQDLAELSGCNRQFPTLYFNLQHDGIIFIKLSKISLKGLKHNHDVICTPELSLLASHPKIQSNLSWKSEPGKARLCLRTCNSVNFQLLACKRSLEGRHWSFDVLLARKDGPSAILPHPTISFTSAKSISSS